MKCLRGLYRSRLSSGDIAVSYYPGTYHILDCERGQNEELSRLYNFNSRVSTLIRVVDILG
jgi:hypothetical protein